MKVTLAVVGIGYTNIETSASKSLLLDITSPAKNVPIVSTLQNIYIYTINKLQNWATPVRLLSLKSYVDVPVTLYLPPMSIFF